MNDAPQFNPSNWLQPEQPKQGNESSAPLNPAPDVASSQPPASSTPPQPSTLIPPAKPRRGKGILFGLLALIVIGGGAALAWYQSPNQVLERVLAYSIEGAVQQFSYSSETVLKLDPTQLPPEVLSATELLGASTDAAAPKGLGGTLTISGEVDAKDEQDVRTHTNVGIAYDAYTANLEVTTIGDIIYLKVSSLPDFGFFDSTSLLGKWVKIDPAALAKQYGVEEDFTKFKEESNLTDDERTQFEELIRQHPIFRIAQVFPIEKVDSGITHHYQLSLDPDATIALLKAAQPIVSEEPIPTEALEELRKELAAMKTMNFEAWLDWFTTAPRKLVITAPIQAGDSPSLGTVTSTIFMRDIGKKPVIEAPTTSVPIQQVIDEFMASQQPIEELEGEGEPTELTIE